MHAFKRGRATDLWKLVLAIAPLVARYLRNERRSRQQHRRSLFRF